ncbi:MAG: hypothetical protein RLN86_13005 [Cyclobacteriaceae bacterium]
MKFAIQLGLLALICTGHSLLAQAPKGINYQGVARDMEGKPLPQKEISIRISILNESANGDMEYDEVHEVRTNSFGLFTLVIGQGQAGTGSFDFISWALGNKWLQIELDENGGRNFKLMGTQQLMSVPYALYAEYAGNGYAAGNGISISNNTITNTGDGDSSSANELITGVSLGPDKKLRITDAGGTKEADLSSLAGAAQNLSDVLAQGNNAGGASITNLASPTVATDAATKAYVDSHSDADADPTNEIQTLSKVGSTVSLSGGGSVALNDDNPTNEIQNISAQSVDANTRSLTLTSANTVNVDVRDADSNSTNEAQTLSKTGATVSLTNVSGSGGGSFVLNDDSNTNEAQSISRTGSNVTLAAANGAGGGSFSIDDNDANPTNEAQLLTRTGSSISLSQVSGAGGGSVSLDDADASPTNEAQTLSKSGTTVTLTNVGGTGGGSFVLNDDSNTNEAQTISRTGSNVTLTAANGAGGGSFSVNDADADAANELQNISEVLAQGNNAGGTKITNLGAPTISSDAATKLYVDNLDAADGDKSATNEIQNLSQVLSTGSSAGNSRITNLGNPIAIQDATTKSYVDAADLALSNRISTTYAFKASFDFVNSGGVPLSDQTMPFTSDFDDFGVLNATSFTAVETGTYIFFVEGFYNTLISGGSLNLLLNTIKYPVTIVLPFGATQPRFSGTFMFKLTAGQTVRLIGDNVAPGAQFNGKFFGNKL